MQQLGDLLGVLAAEGLLAVDEALVDEVDGDLDHGGAGALAVACLQDPELAALDGELDVLHVAEMVLEALGGADEVAVDGGLDLLHGGRVTVDAFDGADGLGCAHARDHVLALGVDKELAEETGGAGLGVAGEGDARGAVVAEVPEDHRLDVDGGAPLAGVAVELAVDDGAGALPGLEDGADGGPELLPGVVGELDAELVADLGLVLGHDLAEGVRGEVGVLLHAAGLLLTLEDGLEGVLVEVGLALQAEDDIAVHGDEAAVGVVGEALVAGAAGEALHGFVVDAEVEDGVHHAGHGDACAGADRNQQGIVGVAEAGAHDRLDVGDAGADLLVEAVRVLLAVRVEGAADLGGDGEAGGNGDAEAAHLGEAGALAAQQFAHAGATLSASIAKEVDELGG